jgi:hypothetical protein
MRPEPALHPWRKYLRFSVRGLIVVVLVIGAGLGWIVHEAHVQRDAVAAIQKSASSVGYCWTYWDGYASTAREPWAPRWLVDLIGVDYFGHVTAVWLNSLSYAPDAALEHVGRLTRLQKLYLDSASVTNVGLAHLKGLTNLTYLQLIDTHVTDAGLAHLKELTQLSYLDLRGTQVTDAGVIELKRDLPGLTIDR